MGAGKTSVGKQLAKLTNKPFFDTDEEIVKRTGVKISWIFEKESEAGFRQREQEVIHDLTHRTNIILSTGGGSITTPNNCTDLSQNGVVIYLQVSLPVQLKRTARRTDTRPLLEGVENQSEVLTKLNAQREPIYVGLADLTYNTDTLEPGELAKRILRDIRTQFEKLP